MPEPTGINISQLSGLGEAASRAPDAASGDMTLLRHQRQLSASQVGRIGVVSSWEQLASSALAADATEISLALSESRRHLMIIAHAIAAAAGARNHELRFNNNTGVIYSWTTSNNFGAPGSGVDTSTLRLANSDTGATGDIFSFVIFVTKRATGEKAVVISSGLRVRGESDAPTIFSAVGQWNLSGDITSVQFRSTLANGLGTNSRLVVFGRDG